MRQDTSSRVTTADGASSITVEQLRGTAPGPTLALLGGVHGDEWEGVAAAGRLCRLLRAREIAGEVRIVAVCNEPAFAAAQRRSPLDDLDLARCFPGDRHGRPSEQLAALLDAEVIAHADFLIDLHSAGRDYTMPTLVGFVDGPPAAAHGAAGAAACFGARATWRHPPPPPNGRTISAAFARGIPALYVETTGTGGLLAADVDCYTEGVAHVMRYLGMLDGPPKSAASPPLRLVGDGDLDAAIVRARRGGILLRRVEPLQLVETGEPIGVIVSPAGDVVETLAAPRRGVVVMLRHTARVVPSDRICHLADLEQQC